MQRSSVDGGVFAPADPADGQADLARLASALWRRRRWIAVPTLIAGLASAAFVMLATPLYRSESLVLIENRETAYNRPEVERQGDRERPLLDAEAVQSQVQLAYSRDLAREVVRDLKLSERPEFNPDAAKSPLSALLSLVGLARDPSRMTFEERVLERYYERLSVYQVERSRVIAISFRSQNAVLAAEVANAVADRLLKFQQKAKQESMRQSAQWLSGEIGQLRDRVGESEARAEEFRGKSNLYIGSNNTSLSAQQLAETNSQLVQARAQRGDAESKARLIREMLRTGRPIEASEVVNSELIRRLNEQRVILRAQLAEQSSTLLGQHPRIKELKAQIADLEGQIRTEAEKLVRSFENDARIASARVEALSASLDQMKKQASALGTEDVQLRALEREAKSQRDLLESYLSRYRDVTAREGADAVPPDARIVSRAVPAATPYFPKKVPIIAIAALAAMIGSITLIAIGELMSNDGAGRGSRRVLAAMAVPVSPVAPPRRWIGAAEPKGQAGQPVSPTEHNRWLATLADHVRSLGRGVVAVTSVESGDLAGIAATGLARELGRRGARVLLLDLDPANAPVASIAGDPRAPGLAELVFGMATFGEVIQRDRASRIHVIPAGRGVRDASALLAGERLAIVLGASSQTYDHVVLAAPPLASMARAGRLARFCRGAVLVTAAGNEGAGAATSDALAAQGFAHVAVTPMGAIESVERGPGQAAA